MSRRDDHAPRRQLGAGAASRARPGKRFSRSATDGSRTTIIVQHRSVNGGAACLPFDEEREVGTPTGRSSATNTCDRNGGTQCDRGSAKLRTSAGKSPGSGATMRLLADGLYLLDGLPPFAINVYLMGSVIVDAGTRHAASRILRQVRGHPVRALTLTHAHPDHQGSCHEVCEALGIPLWCGAADADAVEDPELMLRRLPRNWLTRSIGPLLAGPAHPVARRLREGDGSATSPSSRPRATAPATSPIGVRPTACSSSAMSSPTSARWWGSAASANPRSYSRPTRPRIAARPAGSPPWSRRWSASATGRPWSARRVSPNSSGDWPPFETPEQGVGAMSEPAAHPRR